MRTFLLLIALSILSLENTNAQCDVINDLQILESPDQIVTANMECTDSGGWTHYYNSTENKLLLSIKKNGQDIGSTGLGLIVQSGTLASYGNGAYNLSGADYIANDVWVTSNRFWQVTGANDISSPVEIRFYFSDTDVTDIAESVDDFGFFVDEPDDILAFTLSAGAGIWPYAEITQPVSAIFSLYDMVPGPAPDWVSGTQNDFYFAEFQAETLDNGGGMGFLIFQADPPVSVSGNITRPNGLPVSGVAVEAASTSIGQTGTDGSFSCPTLITGGDYELIPTKDTDPLEGVSVADLIRLGRHLLNMEPLDSPFEFIAADADDDTEITSDDLDKIRSLILGKINNFENMSWRFVDENYSFPNPSNPFTPPFPETIPLVNLPGALNGQNFTGVKIGDLADDSQLTPPALNPTFSFPSVTTCNPGDEIVFPLTVSDFQNMRGFQYTLEWNPEIMEFSGIENIQLPGFTMQSIGQLFTDDGKLTLAWFNPNDNGSTLDDGDIICEFRFVSTGNFGEQTSLNFSNSITEVVLLNQDLSQDLPTFINGGMSIENNSLMTATADVIHAACNGAPSGSVDLSVSNGVPPLSFLWSNGEMTEDLFDIGGGEYRVTVSDNSGNCPKVFFAFVAPSGEIEIEGVSTDMSCPNTVDGSIELMLDGGPYYFTWSNGDTTQNLEGLFTGTYDVTVTDLAGCSETATFEVGNPNQIQPNVSITNASSEDGMDGALTINFIGGSQPPFDFAWSTGEGTQSIENLNPGDYFVTITDGIGCSHVFGYIVSDLMNSVGESAFLPAVNVYPNPVGVGSSFLLDLRSEKSTELQVQLLNSTGSLVWEKATEIPIGDSQFEYHSPTTPGFYFLQVKIDGTPAAWAKLLVR